MVDAPPGSFDVGLQWEWEGEEGAREAVVTPLVINLTDDDGSGSVDLCDTPDVVVTNGGHPPREWRSIFFRSTCDGGPDVRLGRGQ